jgi:hypothetical protein
VLEAVVIALASAALSRLARRAPAREDGWRSLEPSGLHWTRLIFAGALLLFLLYVRVFVGSARHDAERQMNFLTGLIVAFGIAVAFCTRAIVRVRSLGFEWHGNTLAWRNGQGDRVVRTSDALRSVRRSVEGWILSFADGESVELDGRAQGCAELLAQLAEWRPDVRRQRRRVR